MALSADEIARELEGMMDNFMKFTVGALALGGAFLLICLGLALLKL